MPVRPPVSTSFGRMVRFLWMMSLSSSIGTGVYASTLVKPRAMVVRAASTSAWPDSYSAITPYSGWLVVSVRMVVRLDFALRQQRLHFEDRNHRHEAQEQQEQRQEQADRPEEGHEVPLRRVVHAPGRGH